MNDLELTEVHDLNLVNGDLLLLDNDARVAKQSLKINLLFYLGEWFLDNSIGVPYFENILVKTSSTFLADSIIREKAEESYNIASIDALNSSISEDRVYEINLLEGTTLDGEIVSVTNLQI